MKLGIGIGPLGPPGGANIVAAAWARRISTAGVPGQRCDEIALIGPKARIRDRPQAWRESTVTMLTVGASHPETLRFMAEEVL